ncbi:hypothetical protein BGW37DRAFT_465793 [Umbelopsis sp. PMI_123]|nr:hypothetical protein BGW37DRAFT_465793 [Umbelopsis sp. PMI_123]
MAMSPSLKQMMSPRVSPSPYIWKNSNVDQPESPRVPTATSTSGLFLTAPYGVAGQTIAGKIEVQPNLKLDHHATQSLMLEILGLEGRAVGKLIATDVTNRLSMTGLFARLKLESLKIIFHFKVKLPDYLRGSYSDTISRVYYVIRGTKKNTSYDSGTIMVMEAPVNICANVGQATSGENSLYSYVMESNSVSSNCNYHSSGEYGFLDRLSSVLLKLRMKQKPCRTFKLMPVSSLCDVVSSTSISSLSWFEALSSGDKEYVVLGLQTEASIESSAGVETLVEMPIILVHPHSVDPPILVNVYKQAMSRSTFSELLKGTQDTNKSEESDVDDEEDACSPNFSIFHQQVSFPGLHPTELGTAEALTKRVLSETPRRIASQTYKVNIVDPGNLDAVFQEPIPESPLSLGR